MYTEKSPATKPFSRYWLISGVGALALSGLLAIVLGMARSPSVGADPALAAFFYKALVPHVDLSVLVWFLSIGCLLWGLEARRHSPILEIPYLERAAWISFSLGAVLMAVSALLPGEALMSNYIPVIASPVFFLSLALVGCGVGLQLLHYFLRLPKRLESVHGFSLFTAALITLIALCCFAWSPSLMPEVITGQQYYELVFWGGGHLLQLAYGQLAIVAWLALATVLAPGIKPGKIMQVALIIGVAAALAGLSIYARFDIAAQPFRQDFTWGVMGLGGVGPAIALLWIARRISLPSAREKAVFSALVMSLLLFAYGAVLGALIRGQNVTIPAHYHGAIVGITLAFMGLSYAWLPRLGYGEIAHTKLAWLQPVVLGLGQALHVSGLAWSGGYGVLRKTPGGLEHAPTEVRIAMALVGIGMGIAVLGGLMFVISVARSVLSKPKAQ